MSAGGDGVSRVEVTTKTLDTGAVRVPVQEHFHAVCPQLERRVALICAEGFKSYPDTESRAELSSGITKGLPLYNTMKHARRHLNLWLSGDRNEDHLGKVAWAIARIMHQESDCRCVELMEHGELIESKPSATVTGRTARIERT